MSDYASTYGPEFRKQMESQSHMGLMQEMARSLHAELHPKTVLDVGCGLGWMLPIFIGLGTEARGTEHPEARVDSELIFPIDLERDMITKAPDGSYDLVVCIEVAEHLRPEVGPLLVKALCRISKASIWFSAAFPGQQGTGHVNERPFGYWHRRFRERGFDHDPETSERIRASYEPAVGAEWWYRRCRLYRRE